MIIPGKELADDEIFSLEPPETYEKDEGARPSGEARCLGVEEQGVGDGHGTDSGVPCQKGGRFHVGKRESGDFAAAVIRPREKGVAAEETRAESIRNLLSRDHLAQITGRPCPVGYRLLGVGCPAGHDGIDFLRSSLMISLCETLSVGCPLPVRRFSLSLRSWPFRFEDGLSNELPGACLSSPFRLSLRSPNGDFPSMPAYE